jgi:trimeric autotransporter adhesin
MFSLTFGRARRLAGLVVCTAAGLATASGALASGPAVSPNLSAADVAAAWQFPVPNWTTSNKEQGRVDDMVRVGNVVYIAGDFTLAANHSGSTATRMYLAAEDATTGALLPWSPTLNGRAYFLALSPDRSTLYVGGQFTMVNGQPHSHLVAFDVASGRVSPVLPNMNVNGTVKAIAASGSDLYIGGAFTSVSGQPRVRLAKLTLGGTGVWVLNPSWKPAAGDEVRDIIADAPGGRVIVAGWFKTVNGSASQAHIASLSMSSGASLPWANHPGYEVLDLARSGSFLYAAMGGPGGTALAYDIATGRQLWYYRTDGNVQAVTTLAGYPVFGMHGDYVSPKPNTLMSEYGSSARISRHKIFQLTPSGTLTSWAPALTSNAGVLGVWALKSGRGTLYVGGGLHHRQRAGPGPVRDLPERGLSV